MTTNKFTINNYDEISSIDEQLEEKAPECFVCIIPNTNLGYITTLSPPSKEREKELETITNKILTNISKNQENNITCSDLSTAPIF